jgi:hypothetical protein
MRFRLNAAAAYLRSGVPESLRATAEVAGEEWMWKSWGDLLHSVRTGQTAFNHLYGKGTFDWFGEHPDAARLFDEFQAEGTAASAKAIVTGYDSRRRARLLISAEEMERCSRQYCEPIHLQEEFFLIWRMLSQRLAAS